MATPPIILPRADSACGKVFFGDRRSAHGHRIALEFWKRATGQARKGFRLAVYRCKRCGGFHIGRKRVEDPLVVTDSPNGTAAHSTDPSVTHLPEAAISPLPASQEQEPRVADESS